MSFLLLNCVLKSSHQYILLEVASAGIWMHWTLSRQGVLPQLEPAAFRPAYFQVPPVHHCEAESELHHRIGLIHPAHSGRSGCKDSFLLTGPFSFALLYSELLLLDFTGRSVGGSPGTGLGHDATTRSQNQNKIRKYEKMKQIKCRNNRSVNEA